MYTERLRLRPMTVADAEYMARYLGSDLEAVGMTGSIPIPCTEQAAKTWIESRTQSSERLKRANFMIEQKSDGETVGSVGVVIDNTKGWLGYWLGRPFWGKGYATEASAAALAYAFVLGARTAVAEAFIENAASERVLKKLGFVEARTFTEDIPHRGGVRTLKAFQLELTSST